MKTTANDRIKLLLTKVYSFPIHTILVSIYPILYVYSRNLMNIPFRESMRFQLISICFFTFLLISFQIILKDWAKSGAISSLIAGLFYSFGHVASLIESVRYKGYINLNIWSLAWTWLIIFILISFAVTKKGVSEKVTQFLNLISVLLICLTFFTILSIGDINSDLSPDEVNTIAQLRGERDAEAHLRQLPPSEMPDIYYIIFDGYLRSDYLKEYFGFDNGPFLLELEQRGFYIIDSSRSNYLNTNYSLNTSLNLVYFHDFQRKIFNKSKYNLYTNYLHDFLKDFGYKTVVFDSGTGDTNDQEADIFVSPHDPADEDDQIINRFEQFFLKTTMGLLLYNDQTQNINPDQRSDLIKTTVNQELSVRRKRISHALEHLPDYASDDGHYFLFSHIYLPHIPFLYGPDGVELRYQGNQNLYWFEVPQENYAEYYNYQIEYLNNAILETIDLILLKSNKPVVIILQADHGDELYLDREKPTKNGVDFRSAIFNAVLFSDKDYDGLYPTMTPVNTFRVVLNHWFGTEYPLLPDKVFFHEDPLSTRIDEKPDFLDCCEEFDLCLPLPPY